MIRKYHTTIISIAAGVLLVAAALFVPQWLCNRYDPFNGAAVVLKEEPLPSPEGNFIALDVKLDLIGQASMSACGILEEGINQEAWQQQLAAKTGGFFALLNRHIPELGSLQPADFSAQVIKKTFLTDKEIPAVSMTLYSVEAVCNEQTQLTIIFDEGGTVYSCQISYGGPEVTGAKQTALANDLANLYGIGIQAQDPKIRSLEPQGTAYIYDDRYALGFSQDAQNGIFSVSCALESQLS